MTTPAIERSLRFRLSGAIKSLVFGVYGLPFSRFGLEPGLVPFLPAGRPITLIDVGASSGDFTATVIDHCGVRRALLAEAQTGRCKELEARFADPRFVIRQCAVSDSTGAVPFDILNFDYSSSMLPVLPETGGAGHQHDLQMRERVMVPARRLDDLVEEAALTGEIDVLKIDTQGAELHVLRGAPLTLARMRMVWTEVSFVELYQGSALFGGVHAFMREHGFRLHSIHEGFRGVDGELLQADVLFLAPSVRTAVR